MGRHLLERIQAINNMPELTKWFHEALESKDPFWGYNEFEFFNSIELASETVFPDYTAAVEFLEPKVIYEDEFKVVFFQDEDVRPFEIKEVLAANKVEVTPELLKIKYAQRGAAAALKKLGISAYKATKIVKEIKLSSRRALLMGWAYEH